MRLVTRSELARIAAVSPAAVTKACKAQLSDALVGRRVDLCAPSVQQYLRDHGAEPPGDLPVFSDQDVEIFTDLALRVVARIIARAERSDNEWLREQTAKLTEDV